MKKSIICLILGFIISSNSAVLAHHCHSHYYVTYKDYYQDELNFANCDKHYAIKETTVYYYSNGTRRSYVTNTIYNNDGAILASGCSDVKHFVYNKKHYFTFYQNKKYQIIDEFGNFISINNYKQMQEIAPNRLLVKLDKKYGVIDLNNNIITPIKYKEFKQIGPNLFLTKLNGYYGMADNSNNIFIKNEYDKIKPLYDTYLLKKYDKYGLADKNGKFILLAEFDDIEKLGEYILIKKDNKYGVLDSSGNIISNPIYKKIRLERNTLQGKLAGNCWQNL